MDPPSFGLQKQPLILLSEFANCWHNDWAIFSRVIKSASRRRGLMLVGN